MVRIDLKDYTSQVKDLEVAIHTQKSLMRSYKEEIKQQKPNAPKEEKISPPAKPQEPIEPVITYKTPLLIPVALTALAAVLICIWIASMNLIPLALGVFLGLGAVGFFVERKEDTENFESQMAQYQYTKHIYPDCVAKYNLDYDNYLNKKSMLEQQYQEAFEAYELQMDRYNEKYQQMTEKHNDVYNSLTIALEKIYEEDVIFPKYRNLVAISAINEYLLSGRCDKLEGADGAYNLYEMELRQNIVIGQLSSIIDNLEQIKNNQYLLYNELQESNRIVDEIMHDIRDLQDDTKMLKYFAGVIALAETSPRYYYGITM